MPASVSTCSPALSASGDLDLQALSICCSPIAFQLASFHDSIQALAFSQAMAQQILQHQQENDAQQQGLQQEREAHEQQIVQEKEAHIREMDKERAVHQAEIQKEREEKITLEISLAHLRSCSETCLETINFFETQSALLLKQLFNEKEQEESRVQDPHLAQEHRSSFVSATTAFLARILGANTVDFFAVRPDELPQSASGSTVFHSFDDIARLHDSYSEWLPPRLRAAADHVVRTGQVLTSSDLLHDARFDSLARPSSQPSSSDSSAAVNPASSSPIGSDSASAHNVGSFSCCCVPIHNSTGKVISVLLAFGDATTFSLDNSLLFLLISSFLSRTILHAHLHEERQQTVQAMNRAQNATSASLQLYEDVILACQSMRSIFETHETQESQSAAASSSSSTSSLLQASFTAFSSSLHLKILPPLDIAEETLKMIARLLPSCSRVEFLLLPLNKRCILDLNQVVSSTDPVPSAPAVAELGCMQVEAIELPDNAKAPAASFLRIPISSSHLPSVIGHLVLVRPTGFSAAEQRALDCIAAFVGHHLWLSFHLEQEELERQQHTSRISSLQSTLDQNQSQLAQVEATLTHFQQLVPMASECEVAACHAAAPSSSGTSAVSSPSVSVSASPPVPSSSKPPNIDSPILRQRVSAVVKVLQGFVTRILSVSSFRLLLVGTSALAPSPSSPSARRYSLLVGLHSSGMFYLLTVTGY